MRDTQSTMHFGLGLYVVRVIVEYHGGRVQAVNLDDESGVAITVDLPLAKDGPGRTTEDKEQSTVDIGGALVDTVSWRVLTSSWRFILSSARVWSPHSEFLQLATLPFLP